MAKSEMVDDLLAEAMDPSLNQERLETIWFSTKSTRVRKAIASNPNSGKKVLALAARLYIKEVINNPALEILDLFGEDKFVKDIFDAYNEPQVKFSKSRLLSISYKDSSQLNIARTILVSPNLNSPHLLQDVCSVLNSSEFKRELKDDEVRQNVVKIAKKNLKSFNLSILNFLLANGVIDIKDFEKGIQEQASNGLYYWSPKGTYIKMFRKCIDEDNYSLLFKYVTINKPGNLKDLLKELGKNPSFRGDKELSIYSSLYRDCLFFDLYKKREMSESSFIKRGFCSFSYLNDDDFSYHLSKIIWKTIQYRCVGFEEGKTIPDFDRLWKDILLTGFDKDKGPYKCDVCMLPSSIKPEHKDSICEKLIKIVDDECIKFLVTSELLWKEWFITRGSHNNEYKLIKRFNKINKELHDSGKPLLFSHTILGYYPRISFNYSGGSEYNPDLYRVGKRHVGELLPLPRISGKMDYNDLINLASKV